MANWLVWFPFHRILTLPFLFYKYNEILIMVFRKNPSTKFRERTLRFLPFFCSKRDVYKPRGSPHLMWWFFPLFLSKLWMFICWWGSNSILSPLLFSKRCVSFSWCVVDLTTSYTSFNHQESIKVVGKEMCYMKIVELRGKWEACCLTKSRICNGYL